MIDYGMGKTNIDTETGIRYGVISQNSVAGEALDCLEYDYQFSCPQCGNETLVPSKSKKYGHDYYCQSCYTWHDAEDCYGEEPTGFHSNDSDYIVTNCLDNDLMVIKSPYYTYARYCSPCVPGAGNLDSPDLENGVMAYCLGLDWFDEYSPCPYTIHQVSELQD